MSDTPLITRTYAAQTATSPLVPHDIQRAPSAQRLGAHEVCLSTDKADMAARAGTLDFCAQHGIVADIEMIRMEEINNAYERMLKNEMK